MLLFDDLAAEYRDFAGYAEGESATFAQWAKEVATDTEVLTWLNELPDIKRQPNLVFAAARFQGVPAPGPYAGLREALLGESAEEIRGTIMSRATQTNEVGRMATLLPAISSISSDGPVALLEVGASAGLCLYPDQWGYQWETATGTHILGDQPLLPCRVEGDAPLPTSHPQIAWRGGIDLNPLDVTDPGDVLWLETLVWPEQDNRRARLRHAIQRARTDPPSLIHGDLLTELPAAVKRASVHGTVIVFHSAVIVYLQPTERARFDQLMRGLVADGACHWISNEGKRVLPSITETGPIIPEETQTFVLGVDGQARAHTHGHGRAMQWLDPM